jgi:serine/threonine protein kinase
MIADFGLSKHSAEIDSNSVILGMLAYIEPQCFIINNYKRNEKSDIYSLGVLFWEISSGKPPFAEIFRFKIIIDIVKGVREVPINKTPFEYQQLYEKCWKEDPNQRPDIDEIHEILIRLKSNFN